MSRGKNTGRSKDPAYVVWRGMKERCTNPRHKNYKLYKDKLCKEWYKSSKFIEWAYRNGYEEGLTIDRINSKLGYCPENCQFISAKDNTIKGNIERRLVEYDYLGAKYTLGELCDLLLVSRSALSNHLGPKNRDVYKILDKLRILD